MDGTENLVMEHADVEMPVVTNEIQVPDEEAEYVVDSEDDIFDIGDDHEDYDSDSSEEDDLSSDENTDLTENIKVLRFKLAQFVIRKCMSRNDTNELLHILREANINVPLKRHTLLNIQKEVTETHNVAPGQYIHLGLQNALVRCNFDFLKECEEVELDIGVDGVPMSGSSKSSMWPILAAFPGKIEIPPVVVGAYVGPGQPDCVNDFIKYFVDEIGNLRGRIKVTREERIVPFRIHCFITDTPARAFLTGTHYHTHKHGCHKCTQIQLWVQ